MLRRRDCDYGLNNSDTSSSEEDPEFIDLLMSEGIPDGIPRQCFCGADMSLQREPNGPHKRRRYFACCRTRPGPHFRRWWDEAVIEEITMLKEKVQKLESVYLEKNIENEVLKAKFQMLESKVEKLESGVGASGTSMG